MEFWTDNKAGDFAVKLFRKLRHIDGEFAGQPFILSPYQEDATWRMFAEKRCDEYGKKVNIRRYRQVYIEVPRKQGKTVWAAGLAIKLLCFDDEPAAKIYAAAKTRDQATLVYDYVTKMMQQNEYLSSIATFRRSPKRVYIESTNSTFFPLASDDGAAHGLNAHGIIFDELHTQPNRKLWDALLTSRGARRQPLIISLTTAGHDRSSICWEMHQYAKGVMQGAIDDPYFLPIIYAADESDDWTDEETWRKANPNLGVTVKIDYLREEFAKAKAQRSAENAFKNLYLNQWTGQSERWYSVDEWDACADEMTRDELWNHFRGKECWCGLDLSATRDATAFVMVFHDDRCGQERFVMLPTIWIPQEPATKRDAQDTRQLRNWADGGWVRMDAGRKDISIDAMEQRIVELRDEFDIRAIAFDPYHAKELVQRLENRGFTMTKFAQTAQNFAQPCAKLETILGNETLRHDGNQAMRWMLSNVAKRMDHNGNCKPDKGASGDKIDGVVAAIMGLGLAMNVEFKSVYSEAGAGTF